MKPFTIRKAVHPQAIREQPLKEAGDTSVNVTLCKRRTEPVKPTTDYIQRASEEGIQIDEATKEALEMLEKDKAMWSSGLLDLKTLARYDVFEGDQEPEAWMEACLRLPGQAHGLSPVCENYEYIWKPVEVLAYDAAARKFKVKIVSTGIEKSVIRLSLLFFTEDEKLFKERVRRCRELQQTVQAELKFTNLVDSVPMDAVSELPADARIRVLKSVFQQQKGFSQDQKDSHEKLVRVAEQEYIRQMKKCVIQKEMVDPQNWSALQKLNVPVKLQKASLEYFGTVQCPAYNFPQNFAKVQGSHFSQDVQLEELVKLFMKVCLGFEDKTLVQTDRELLKAPAKLTDIEKRQNEHLKAVAQRGCLKGRD